MPRSRIRIDGDGFITEESENRLLSLPGINRDLVEAVVATVKFANEIATSVSAHAPHETPEEKQKVIALALLVRLIEIVESIFILSAHGIRQELHTLFRVFLDAYFLIANVCSDAEFVRVYFLTDEPNRLKLLNAATKHDHELFSRLKEYGTEELRTELDHRIKEDKIQTFNSFLFAENVGCAEIYDSLYRISSASVHTSPRCLKQYVEADVQGNIVKILHKGDAETTREVLYDTMCFLLKALRGISELFVHPATDRITQLEVAIEAAMTEHENTKHSVNSDVPPAGGASVT